MEIDDDVLNVFRSHREQLEGLKHAINVSIARHTGQVPAWFTEEWSAAWGALQEALNGVTCHWCEDEAASVAGIDGPLCAGCADKRVA